MKKLPPAVPMAAKKGPPKVPPSVAPKAANKIASPPPAPKGVKKLPPAPSTKSSNKKAPVVPPVPKGAKKYNHQRKNTLPKMVPPPPPSKTPSKTLPKPKNKPPSFSKEQKALTDQLKQTHEQEMKNIRTQHTVENNKLSTKLKAAQKEIEKKLNTEHKKEMQQEKQKYEQKFDKMVAEKERLKEEKDKLKTANIATVKQLKNESAALKKVVVELESKQASLKFGTSVASSASASSPSPKAIASLPSQPKPKIPSPPLNINDTRLHDIQIEMKKLEEKNQQIEKSLQQKETLHKQTQQQLKEHKLRQAEQTKTQSKTQLDIEQATKEIQNLKTIVKTTKSKCDALTRRCKELEEELEETSDRVASPRPAPPSQAFKLDTNEFRTIQLQELQDANEDKNLKITKLELKMQAQDETGKALIQADKSKTLELQNKKIENLRLQRSLQEKEELQKQTQKQLKQLKEELKKTLDRVALQDETCKSLMQAGRSKTHELQIKKKENLHLQQEITESTNSITTQYNIMLLKFESLQKTVTSLQKQNATLKGTVVALLRRKKNGRRNYRKRISTQLKDIIR